MLRNSEGIIVRLLIVEDEVRLASALQRGLIGEGFSVDVTHTGPDGLHAAQENQYDAVILDIMLPGLSGYRIIERLRGAKNWVPILMLTAKDGEYDEADALDLGADDYLTKPFSFLVLLARLRALLRRGVTPRPAALTVGDLVLDPAAHTVVRGERSVDLTPREFALLEYLMPRPGRLEGRHPAPRLGRALRRRRQRRRGVRGLPAPQDRHPVRAAERPDGARCRLPAQCRVARCSGPGSGGCRTGGAPVRCGRGSRSSRPRCSPWPWLPGRSCWWPS